MNAKHLIAAAILLVSFAALLETGQSTSWAPHLVPKIKIGRIPHLDSWTDIDRDLELKQVAEDVGGYLSLTAPSDVSGIDLADFLDDIYTDVQFVAGEDVYYYIPQPPPNPPIKVCVPQGGIEIVSSDPQSDLIFVDMNWTVEY